MRARSLSGRSGRTMASCASPSPPEDGAERAARPVRQARIRVVRGLPDFLDPAELVGRDRRAEDLDQRLGGGLAVGLLHGEAHEVGRVALEGARHGGDAVERQLVRALLQHGDHVGVGEAGLVGDLELGLLRLQLEHAALDERGEAGGFMGFLAHRYPALK